MKRFLCHTLGGAALALSFSLSAPVLAQETIVHPGDALQSIDNSFGGTYTDVLTTSVNTVNGSHKSLSVTGNSVTLDSGTPGYVFGAVNYGDTDGLSDNSVVINGGTVSNNVSGAQHSLENGNTSATSNSVTINGGALGNIYGGDAFSDLSGAPLASGNTVLIAGGTVGGDIHGGRARSVSSGQAESSNNTVSITGGTANRIVYGGYAYSDSGQAEASNNTVHIGPGLPATVFGSGVYLYGGEADTNTGTRVSTGNTLQIESAGLSVEELRFFQRFEFTLPAGLANGDVVLAVTDVTALGSDAVMTVSAAPGFNPNPGDAFTLIECTGMCAPLSGTVAAASQSGTVAGYPYTLEVERIGVVLRILPRQSTPAAAPIPVASGGVLAALGLLLAGLAAVGLRRRRC